MSGQKTGRPRQDAAKRKSMQGREHLYSLYTSLPQPPALNSLPSTSHQLALKRAEDKIVSNLDELHQDGGALYALKDILGKEAKRVSKSSWRQGHDERKRASKADSEGEGGESEDGGDEVSEAKVSKKRKRARRGELQMELPEMLRPEVELPEDLPPGDLLTSIHEHASTLLSTTYNILPPLTPSSPRHSPSTIAHFDALTSAQAQNEADVLANASVRIYKAIAAARVIKGMGEKSLVKQIGRNDTWKNAEKGFESSALVAVGMFMQLLAADTVSKSLVEAVPPQLLPLVEQGRQPSGGRKKRRKGKEKAANQGGEDEEGDEDDGEEDAEMEGAENDELLDPSTLVARALGLDGVGGEGLEMGLGIDSGGGGRTAVR
ncbi:hypothetical protein BCR35DRAFT_355189 [Leucosporidium creatinivorum]|uniref:Uncharacterized protein n=1 Tax=Leucosporidium creatinivorum TaxID=106004 RepID=A0A1Y2DPF7_9BASI|nr:hypothetical protein BCR35DRAFT_355189 [Leucosporidium creatinivorum]